VHEHRARAYAAAKNWEVSAVYHLEGVSGKSVIDHPEARRMIGDLRAGTISGLIFSKMARLGRNTRELLEFAELFNSHDADLISIQESIDTTTPGGRLFYTLLAAITQWEREEIVERIKASVPIRARLGKPLNGNATLGYRLVAKRLVPDPDNAPLRKLLYLNLARYRRIRTVARMMNSSGYRTSQGSLFNFRSVRRLIQETTPMGLRKMNYTSLNSCGRVQKKPQSEWVISQVEPIVSVELWNFCNKLIADRKSEIPPGRQAVQLFGGLTWCECGNKMYVPSNNPKYVCRSCHSKLCCEALENLFITQVYHRPEVQACIRQADPFNECRADLEALSHVVVKELSQVSAELEKLDHLYASRHLAEDGYNHRKAKAVCRQEQLQLERTRLENRLKNIAPDGISPLAQTVWESCHRIEKRRRVELCVVKVIIDHSFATFCLRTNSGCMSLACKPSAPLKVRQQPLERASQGCSECPE